jgi:hypothetical protein
MKKLLVLFVLSALLVAVSGNANAQSKLALSVGGDVLLPMGTFSDVAKMGFGGSVRGQYNITPDASVGLTVGYFTWTGKDLSQGTGVTYTGGGLSGLPIRVFGKYYFMPEAGKVRVYGIAELGFFMGKVGDVTIPGQTIGGFTIPGQTIPGGTSTDFNYAPGVGAEFPLGSGSTKLDASMRYDGIATTGGSSGNLGVRVGVLFPLGN